MFKKIISVETKEDFIIIAEFDDEVVKKYDVKPLFNEISIFKDLKNIVGLFEQVKIDVGGYGIVWNDYIDLSSDEIYNRGVSI